MWVCFPQLSACQIIVQYKTDKFIYRAKPPIGYWPHLPYYCSSSTSGVYFSVTPRADSYHCFRIYGMCNILTTKLLLISTSVTTTIQYGDKEHITVLLIIISSYTHLTQNDRDWSTILQASPISIASIDVLWQYCSNYAPLCYKCHRFGNGKY